MLTQAWWTHQLSGNVATVTLGASSRQFVRTPDNAWFAPGPGYATMTMSGTRTPDNYMCPAPVWPQDPHYALSRGWDEFGLSFTVNNQHGDAQNFEYFFYKYSTDSQFICARNLGFRLKTWTFPQGVTVHLDYALLMDQSTLPPDELPGYTWELSRVWNSFGASTTAAREIDFDYGIGGVSLQGFNDGHGRSITASPGAMASTTDTQGMLTSFTYLTPHAASATQRPVVNALLSTITTPETPALPHVEYDYDSEGRIKQVKDAEALQKGDRLPYQFFLADGTRGARQDPLGGLYSVVYDVYGHPSRYIDELGQETKALIDSRERPVSYTFPEGDCEGFAYDDHNNTTAYYRIDKTGSCNLTVAGSHRILTQATWDQTWNKPLTIKTPLANTTTFSYYASGNGTSLLYQAKRPSPDGVQSQPTYTFTYDTAGGVQTATVPFTNTQIFTTTNAYDPTTEDLLSTTLDSAGIGIATHFTYDVFGNVITTTDPLSAVTSDTYDSERRKTESHHHDGGATATLNAASRTTYDAIGRDTKDEFALTFSGTNVSTWQTDKTTVYTPTSKVATVTDADGSTSATIYDGLDRADTVIDPIGRKSHSTYDLAGNTLKEYRGWQSAVEETYATYTYGNDNEKLSVADANSNLTTFFYDGFNRLLTTTFPDSTVAHPDLETLVYDKDSNVTSRTTRANQAITYAFDKLDRMITKTMPAVTGVNPLVTTTWAYYLNSAINTLTDTSANGLTYGYDTAGRMTSVSTAIPGITGALVNGYVLDLNGNRTQLTWPDGYFVAYAYDSLNRMTTAKESGTATLATYSYNALSRPTNLAYPNANMAYTYSSAGNLLTLNHTISGTTGTVPQYTMGYTPAHQLTSEASSDSTYILQLASTGTDSYTVNALNQYKAINSAPANGHDCQGNAQQYSYDCNGNLIGNGTWTYAYDPENRLITANKTSGSTVAATYAYDPLGRRTHKSGTGVTETYFVDDGPDEIAEYNASGSPVTRYVPGAAVNEPIASFTVSNSAHRYFQTDHHGSVIAMVSQGGNEVEGPYTYDVYGNCFVGSSSCSNSGTPYRFVGMRYEPETGLYFDRERMYSSILGRFLQTDPVGFKVDLNLYTYAGNDPEDMTDPMGTDQVCVVPTGSHIASACVNVNGDKKTLTADQKNKIGGDFRTFILNHSGKDITANGARVSGGSPSQDDFISAVSQFTGTAIREWSHQGWNGISIALTDSYGMQMIEGEWGGGESAYGYSNGNILNTVKFREIDINTDQPLTFGSAANAARVIMHERLHWLWTKDHDNPSAVINDLKGEHTALDNQARWLLHVYGLSDRGCDAMGDSPACSK